VLVEESVSGIEPIVGGSIDYEFGPVILPGLGGTAVEVCKDTSIRF
jgi:acetate---CoA ligase (ADP-forming) subunit beta